MTGQTTAEQISATAAFDKTFSHHTATVNGVRLHYVIGGQGEPVVLLHGFPETWYAWRKVMPALAEHYTVIAPDMRGLGDSERPYTGYEKKTLAEDIYQLVRQLGYERIFLVGHDKGTEVAFMYAALHREELRRLVLLEALIPGLGYEQAMDNSRGEGVWHFTFHAVPNIPEALVAGRERMYITEFIRAFAYNPAAIAEADIDEYVRCYTAPGAMRAGFTYYRTVFEDAKEVREHTKTKLSMPVLVLGGRENRGDSLLKAIQPVAENVRGGVIEHCGHWIAEEQPEELARQLLSFFGEGEHKL